MGRARHEIPRIRESRDQPAGRAISHAGQAHAGEARHPEGHIYRWCDLYHTGGPEALGDRSPRPDRVWNQIPDMVRDQIIKLALDEPTLSPRELAVRFTDTESYFVSEASVYRL